MMAKACAYFIRSVPRSDRAQIHISISRQSGLRYEILRRQLVERRTPTFEDIHAVAARIAARKMTASQRRRADREAKRLSQGTHTRHATLKTQLYRIGFFNEAARLVDDDRFGFD